MFAQKIRVDWLAETLANELKFLNHLSRKAIWSQEQSLSWEWMSRKALPSKGFKRCLTNS
jgi:hypothetical protein